MEKLLSRAEKHCDQVELYSIDNITDAVTFQDGKLSKINSRIQNGMSIRIIKDNKLGFAYTKNLINRDEILNNALNSLKGNITAEFSLPHTKIKNKLKTYEPMIEQLENAKIVDECNRVAAYLSSKTKGQVNLTGARTIKKIRLMNSAGTDITTKTSEYFILTSLLLPNSYAGIRRVLSFKKFTKTPQHHLDYILRIYKKAAKVVKVNSGSMKVLFMPEAMYVLTWRIASGTSGQLLYDKQSPIAKKKGKKVFHEKITIINNPLDDTLPDARAYDDEGTPCTVFPIVQKGVLKNFYYDLYYASKMNQSPTGHGFRSGRWSSETIAAKPAPALSHLNIKPGKIPFTKLVEKIDRGVIIAGILGAHSGNIPNGDFSIGLSPGLYVENGEIIGRVKDAMVAGNIYNTMNKVIAIENELHPASMGMFPAILFDDVKVSTSH